MEIENFKIIRKAEDMNNLIYEDSSCYVYCNVADYRDKVLWTVILSAWNRITEQDIELTKNQKNEVYKRINYSTVNDLNKQLYVDKLGMIEQAPESLTIPLLDWR